MNYQEPRAYSHTFAGKDDDDRYRIKQKAKVMSLIPLKQFGFPPLNVKLIKHFSHTSLL
ncbi:hypothetical protein DPF89_03190 [Salmonella enterica subsp. enterica serovar Napoli]|nr:hypothetical protein DPF89_03190 [Salmonella enterica subsp. enterica serovar Napoli]